MTLTVQFASTLGVFSVLASLETVTRASPMLTGAPNKVRGRSAQPVSE
jgi:hypothetical protein